MWLILVIVLLIVAIVSCVMQRGASSDPDTRAALRVEIWLWGLLLAVLAAVAAFPLFGDLVRNYYDRGGTCYMPLSPIIQVPKIDNLRTEVLDRYYETGVISTTAYGKLIAASREQQSPSRTSDEA